MAYNNYQSQGNYAAQPGSYQQQPKSAKRREDPENQVKLTGTIRPMSANEQDTITYYPSKYDPNAGFVQFLLKRTDFTGRVDENGNQITRNLSVPVKINTNKDITPQMLQSLVSGMVIHITGELMLTSYESKKTGGKVSTLQVKAYNIKILSGPAVNAQPQQQMPQYGYQQQAPGYGPQGMQQPMPQGYQQPYQQQAPQYGQQGYYGPGMPPAYGQQAPAVAPQMPPQQAQPAAPAPPYYQPAPQPAYGQGQQMPPAYHQATGTQNPADDLPVA